MHIVILADLLRLPAHDKLDTHGAPTSYAFGISFAPVFERDTDTDAIPDIFQAGDSHSDLSRRAGPLVPWCWNEAIDIGVWGFDGKNYSKQPLAIKLMPLPSPRNLMSGDLDTIEQRIVTHCFNSTRKAASGGGPTFDPTTMVLSAGGPDLPSNTFLYPAFLQSAAAWPAPVPHGRLNFVRFFTVDAAQLATSQDHIVAAPLFTVDSGGDFTTTYDPNSNNGATNVNYKNSWSFQTIPNILVQARCKACAIAVQPSSDSFLELNTLWLRNGLPSGSPSLSTDAWFEKLPARLGETFDLAARLVGALESQDQTATTLRTALLDQKRGETADLAVLMVLRALHDRLGPVWGGANNTALFESEGALVHRLLNPLFSADKSLQDARDILLAGLVGKLPALLKSERDPTNWTSLTQAAAKNTWIARLARRLSAVSDLSSDPTTFLQEQLKAGTITPADPASPFQMARLASVVATSMRPEVLADLLVDSWGAAPLDQPAKNALASLEVGGLRKAIVSSIVATRVRRALLQPAWSLDGLFKRPTRNLVDDSDLKLLLDNAILSFGQYGLGTLATGSGTQPGVEGAYETNFGRSAIVSDRNALREALKAVARATFGDLSRSSKALMADDQTANVASASPGGITIQLDRVVRGATNGTSGGDDDDFHRNLAGYGILARLRVPGIMAKARKTRNLAEGVWRSLSIVNIGLDEKSFTPLNENSNRARKGKAGKKLLSGTNAIETVVALTPGYDGDLPTAAVQYDNAPLVGKAIVARRVETKDQSDSISDPFSDPIIVPLQPRPGFSGNPSQAARLPFIAFGLDVDVVGFAVTNHGAIPKELALNGFPALLKDNRDNLGPPDTTRPNPYIRTIPYRRRVAVGALGLSENLLKPDPLKWNGFAVDSAMRLLSDELPETGLPNMLAFNPDDPSKRPMPRALLLVETEQKKTTTTFKVRAPSVDIEVFDRWIAYDEFVATDAAVKAQIRACRKSLRNYIDDASRETTKTPYTNTYSIGDPAVSLFFIRATRVFSNGASDNHLVVENSVDWSLSLTDLPPDAKPGATHRPAIEVSLAVSASPAANRLSVNPVSLQIAPGEVWKVEFYAGVASRSVDAPGARFDRDLFHIKPTNKDRWEHTTVNGNQYYLVSPFVFALEGGSSDLPTAQEIYDAFQPSLSVSADHPGEIALAWNRLPTIASAAVGAVNIAWQQWRSTGRPPSPFPYAAIGNLDELPTASTVPSPATSYPFLWEVEAFADRPDEPSQGRRFEPKLIPQSNPALLGSERPLPAEPARYLRYQVSAENRYASLYNPTLQPRSGVLANSARWTTNWKRIFRPVMPIAVSAISVRSVVPLTRSIDTNDTSQGQLSGVLMVIDGAVGEAGGIAESVEVRAVHIVRLLQPTFKAKAATEFGADPILRSVGRKPGTGGTEAAVSLRITGPIGHTFDIDARAPAFQSSSFIVAPPDFAANDPGAGWMAKVRARRVLDPRAVAGYGRNNIKIPAMRRRRTANDEVILPLTGDDDLSLTFEDLALQPGRQITITLTADRGPGESTDPNGEEVPVTNVVRLTADLKQTSVEFGGVVAAVTGIPSAIRMLVTRRRILNNGLPVDRFEGTLEAIDFSGDIIRAGEIEFQDSRATGAVELRISSSAPVTLKPLRAPLASDWTEMGWTQFLPDTRTTMRNSAGQAVGLTLKINNGALSATADVTANWLSYHSLTDRASKDDQGLIHFLLLTRTVLSTSSGQNDEAYVGLYILQDFNTGNTADFVPFGTTGTAPNSTDDLRARIMTVQADPRVWTSLGKVKNKRRMQQWLDELQETNGWDQFFKLEKTLGRELAEPAARVELLSPQDADLRIVTVYAPFGSGGPVTKI